jgi:RNA polymerase sigma-70 factor (ECF subfamily)
MWMEKMNLPMATQRQSLRSIEEAVCATIDSNKTGRKMTFDDASPVKSTFEQPGFLRDLIRRSRDGDTQAMGSIYEHFKSPLFGLAYRYTNNATAAEDLIQDIFLKVFTSLSSLDKDKAFVGWLYRIAVNTCLSYIRSHKRAFQKEIPLGEVEGILNGSAQGHPEDMLNKSIAEALQTLSPKLKSVFMLHDIQGFKHDEVAQILDCSVGTSKSQLFKARMKIRHHLEKKQVL